VQEGRQYLDQLNSSIGRDAMMLREAAQAIEEVRGAESNTKSGVGGPGGRGGRFPWEGGVRSGAYWGGQGRKAALATALVGTSHVAGSQPQGDRLRSPRGGGGGGGGQAEDVLTRARQHGP
jgi:hypothetical protein